MRFNNGGFWDDVFNLVDNYMAYELATEDNDDNIDSNFDNNFDDDYKDDFDNVNTYLDDLDDILDDDFDSFADDTTGKPLTECQDNDASRETKTITNVVDENSTTNNTENSTLIKSRYKNKAKSIKRKLFAMVVAICGIILICYRYINEFVSNVAKHNTMDFFVLLFRLTSFSILLLVVLWFIIYFLAKLDDLTKEYLPLLNDAELEQYKKDKRMNKIVMVIIVLFILGIISISITKNLQRKIQRANTYNDIVALVDSGAYDKAYIRLYEFRYDNNEYIENEDGEREEICYKDTISYIYLCDAHLEYEKGNIYSAYWALQKITFNYLSDEQVKVIEDFSAVVTKAYNDYITNLS